MISLALVSQLLLTIFAQNSDNNGLSIGGIEIPNLIGCDLSALKCLENVTSLILPSGCGIPPQSVYTGQLNEDTIDWAKCACPTLVPAYGW
jgi:hypothetical protein